MNNDLEDYKSKRDFDVTSEPAGRLDNAFPDYLFVVQKHNATNLHYDFRIRVDNTLKSWAIPKGPSLNPAERRLAIQTEDHPLEYSEFEGVIPEGQYGAGAVVVWDRGIYKNIKVDGDTPVPMSKAYESGSLEIYLMGEKLKGAYALFKTDYGNGGWLLVKKKDKYADTGLDITESMPESVISGKTIEGLEKERENQR